MANPKKPNQEVSVGQPTKYDPALGQKLVDHMGKGGSLESFGAIAGCSTRTLYNWLAAHPEFLQARKDGEPGLHRYYEEMGKSIALGQLRRVVSEEPMIIKDSKGNEVVATDAKGNVLYKREYEHVSGNSTAWIFLCKNMLGWRDRREIALFDPEGDDPGQDMTAEERLREIKEMMQYIQEVQGDGKPVIDVSPKRA